MDRPAWPEYFMSIAHLVAKRSTCLRRNVGAVLVRDKCILATGYNGAPSGIKHCSERGCMRMDLSVPSGMRHELCRGLHAEQNVIIQAAYHGIAICGASLYVTNQPCVICAKMIINAGIEEIIYENPYDDELAISLLQETGIKLSIWDDKKKKILKKVRRKNVKT